MNTNVLLLLLRLLVLAALSPTWRVCGESGHLGVAFAMSSAILCLLADLEASPVVETDLLVRSHQLVLKSKLLLRVITLAQHLWRLRFAHHARNDHAIVKSFL